jgi:hypothetical protein
MTATGDRALTGQDGETGYSPRGVAGPAALAIMLLSLFVLGRSLLVAHQQFWLDEATAVGIASEPLSGLHRALAQDGSPPLYFVILHVWMAAFGQSETSTHVLSVVFGVLAVPAAWWAAAPLTGRMSAGLAALFVAGNPIIGYYATETRMYELVVLESLVVVGCWLRLVEGRGRWRVVALAVSLAATAYTHNWAAYLGLTLALATLALGAVRRDHRLVLRVAAAGGAALALYVPWLATLLGQAQQTGAPWSSIPTAQDLALGLVLMVGGTNLAALRAVLWMLPPWRSALTRTSRPAPALLGAGAFTALAVAWAVCHAVPGWTDRYYLVFAGPVTVALAGSAVRGPLRLCTALVVCVVVLGAGLVETVHGTEPKSRFAEAVERTERPVEGDVVAVAGYLMPLPRYYWGRGPSYVSFSGPVAHSTFYDYRNSLRSLRQADPEQQFRAVLAALRPGRRLFIVQVPPGVNQANEWWRHWQDLQASYVDLAMSSADLETVSTTQGISVRIDIFERRDRSTRARGPSGLAEIVPREGRGQYLSSCDRGPAFI